MEGDAHAFESSVQNNDEPILFESRRYNYITDATSNQGQFNGGQIQFVLDTLNSQSQWVNLSEAVIEFPIKITAQVTTAMGGSTTSTANAEICSAILKNGFHQWFDGAQLIINGQTIQSLQQYENVAASFRILSKWSQDTLKKWGTTTGFALDDMTGDTTNSTTAGIDKVGLNNALYTTVATSTRGFDAVNNQAVLANRGLIARAKMCNTGTTDNTLLPAALLTPAVVSGTAGIANVGFTPSNSTSTPSSSGTNLYSQFIMGSVRVRDLFDISEFPMVKNIRGFLYLNFNSFAVALTSTGE